MWPVCTGQSTMLGFRVYSLGLGSPKKRQRVRRESERERERPSHALPRPDLPEPIRWARLPTSIQFSTGISPLFLAPSGQLSTSAVGPEFTGTPPLFSGAVWQLSTSKLCLLTPGKGCGGSFGPEVKNDSVQTWPSAMRGPTGQRPRR